MKKSKKALLSAAMFAAALGAGVYATGSDSGEPQKVTALDFSNSEYKPESEEYVTVYGPPAYFGDFDNNEDSNAVDLLIGRRLLMTDSVEASEFEIKYAFDVNFDGKMDALDLLIMKAYSFGQIASHDDPIYSVPQPVYGPPDACEITTTTPVSEYNPEKEIPQDVYGPPEYFETTVEPVTEYIPETEIPQPVYGPPLDFEE